MTSMEAAPNSASTARSSANLVLIAAVICGASYLASGGVNAGAALTPIWKASGILLLALYAAMRGCFALAAALVASAVGDIALALRPQQTLAGIGAFAVGHVIYAGIFAAHVRARGVRRIGFLIAAGLIALAVATQVLLYPHLGEFAVPVWIYTAIIMAMAALAALSRTHILAVTGALLFVFSDTVLSFRMFAGAADWAGPVVWIAYFSGQVCLAIGVASSLRTQAAG